MRKVIISVLLFTALFGQSTWIWSGRVHPELKWTTISTKHFNIHYHQGIEEIARKGASIAEQVRSTLLKQMELDTLPKIDIIFTAEDEIMNGFALWTYTTFIWVDQNDAAVWLEDEKWLYQVLAHELQHIVFFHRTKTWMPQPWGFLFSKTPGWMVEGLAEYETERWRPYRSDLSHKYHVLTNKMQKMDPHHDGFSKLLYWSDRFGDSTIVKVLKYRNKIRLHDFKKGFKQITGISVKQFNEDWRRHMNTYYYGVRAQKEPLEEVGQVVTLPIKKMSGFQFTADSMKIALLGRDDKNQYDQSLYIAIRDTAKENKLREKQKKEREKKESPWLSKLFKTKPDTIEKKLPPPKVIWDKEEVDYGRFHTDMSWSPEGHELAYAKFHFGKHQSMIWDLRIYDVETKKGRWLTHSQRATYPTWSPDSATIAFVAHKNSVSDLFTISSDGSNQKQLTNSISDTQILNPVWSPDGKTLAFAKSEPDGNMDLFLLDISSGKIRRLTDNPAVDYKPVWHPSGQALSYTSHAGGTPNIHTINLADGTHFQVTDVGDALWTRQWVPGDSLLFATTLTDVDTVRVLKINPFRQITTSSLTLRDTYTRWKSIAPALVLENIDPGKPVDIVSQTPYRFTRHIKHFTSLVLPFGKSAFGLTQWGDAMGRNLFVIGGFYDVVSPSRSGWFLGYTNAMIGPLWSVSYYNNLNGTYQLYDKSKYGLWDLENGLTLSMELPYNFGNTFSAEHKLIASISLINHRPTVSDSLNKKTGKRINRNPSDYKNLPVPEKGREGIFSLSYQWLSRRPHAWNMLHPIHGHGFFTKLDYANAQIYGKFNYLRITTDFFINIPMGKTSLYGRLKTMATQGAPPAQDYVGLTNDFPIYLMGMPGPVAQNSLPENHNPRGWSGYRLGDRLIFSTFEYRLPIIPKIFSIALFSDLANSWYIGKHKDAWILTAGYEVRFAFFIAVLSIGEGQSVQSWKENIKPERYFRLALINPF